MWRTYNSLPSSFLILFIYSFSSFWVRVSTNVGNTKTKPNKKTQTTTTTNPTGQANKNPRSPECQQKIYRGMQSRMMLQIKPRIRLSRIQKLSAVCNYSGNCYFKMFSFFQRNSMLLAEILGILNHSKSLCSWWRLNIIGNQNNLLSTYFSWLKKKSSFWNFFKKLFYYVVLANYSIFFRPKH